MPITDAPTWIIDPIDGTTNFVHSYPIIGICIGLAINRQTMVGIVYNPILNEKFTAIRGKGAFLNGQRIYVDKSTSLANAIISTNVGYDRSDKGVTFVLENLRTLLDNKVRGIRVNGSAASGICDVACGRISGYYEWGPHTWDLAAASLLVEEAGGTWISPNNSKGAENIDRDLTRRSIICGNSAIVKELDSLLNKDWPIPPQEKK